VQLGGTDSRLKNGTTMQTNSVATTLANEWGFILDPIIRRLTLVKIRPS
jgi:hypothetical protein